MSKVFRWGLSVLTMASVAAVVLLVSGWGSAIASSLSATGVVVKNTISNPANVHEIGTASVSITNLPATQPVSGSVSVSNLPAPATTEPIDSGTFIFPGNDAAFHDFFVGDVSAYHEVTFYLNVSDNNGVAPDPGIVCQIFGVTGGFAYLIGSFQGGGDGLGNFIKTYFLPPPSLKVSCFNGTADALLTHWSLVGRTG